jgi:integrase
MQATLRLFLSYCFLNGITKKDLSPSIPTLRTYKLATTPKGIADKDAQKILGTIDRTTHLGRRNYAILRLLYHYGARAGQIGSLQLGDIRWREETITFRALIHGKTVVVPLLVEVGNALIDYLRHARPPDPCDAVFLTVTKPYRSLGSHSAISEIVAHYLRELKTELPRGGGCAFRHSFAQRMLRQGNSLKSIADCLGHRSIQTTAIYAKVDFLALNNVALDLPAKEV